MTTLRNKHVKVRGSALRLEFRGKSGKVHCVTIEDPQLARQIRRCQELPGQELFQYLDEGNARRAITSDNVNPYLREKSDGEFTAKDFRTWAGTVMAAIAPRGCAAFETATQANANVVQAIKDVAKRLGNTPAVCRRCYVRPAVIDAYLEGDAFAPKPGGEHSRSRTRLKPKKRQCSPCSSGAIAWRLRAEASPISYANP